MNDMDGGQLIWQPGDDLSVRFVWWGGAYIEMQRLVWVPEKNTRPGGTVQREYAWKVDEALSAWDYDKDEPAYRTIAEFVGRCRSWMEYLADVG